MSKELDEIRDSTSALRKRLAEMMNSLLSDLVSGLSYTTIYFHFSQNLFGNCMAK